ncbi:ABC transporter permease [Vibrio hannami]|uniref:ABC transporter permease n=1 Tax=Vibrio hannami TaxID=2717094 RepID=UPI00240F10D4|nr:ABC transporter permease [Vibrio hannami]MDG3086394.1 ABC transporter permease [Vibrio hannami]
MNHSLFNKKHQFFLALFVALLTVVIALLGPLLAPHDPLEADFLYILSPPNDVYLLGTDQVGRDILSRLLHGAAVSLGITFGMLAIIFVLGICIGSLAGMRGGHTDTFLMRLSDALLAFPDMVFAIAVVGLLGPGIINMMIALGIIWWTKFARLSRVLIKSEMQSEAIIAGRMAGASNFKLFWSYLLPAVMPALLTQLSLDIGNMMLAMAGLSFLGLGIQPPTPEWGNMLSEGRTYLQSAPWLVIYPGIAIFIVVMIFNILGDTTRKYLNPERS